MSLYKECSKAVDALIKQPPAQHDGVFTEIDVVNKAARREWSNDNYKAALKHANQVCGTKYRERKLCRYGPITLPDGTQDYARIASKIVYADAQSGPDVWDTPNGKFPKMMIEDDPLKAQGRRKGTTRNDLAPWDDQTIRHTSDEKDVAHELDVGAMQRRIERLEHDLTAAISRAERAEAEAARQRAHSANGGQTEDEDADVFQLIEDLQDRVAVLEDRDRRRAEIAAA